MVAASTLNLEPGTQNSDRPWSPNTNDHLIYDWVKMQGKTQAQVASMLNIHQGTVSRTIQRYERWQAHAKDREAGRLDHAERLRAQHWLTYDRNELILASCLRIAQEMEGFVDSTKSTVTSPGVASTQKNELRTTHFTIDRTGTVCRFLRLAHRINMEQLKLAKVGPVPLPEPLSPEELAQQALDDDALDAELLASPLLRDRVPKTDADEVGWAPPTTDDVNGLVTRVPPGDAPPRGSSLGDPPTNDTSPPALNPEPRTLNPPRIARIIHPPPTRIKSPQPPANLALASSSSTPKKFRTSALSTRNSPLGPPTKRPCISTTTIQNQPQPALSRPQVAAWQPSTVESSG